MIISIICTIETLPARPVRKKVAAKADLEGQAIWNVELSA